MNELDLKEFNEAVDRIIEDEKKYPLNINLLLEMFSKMKELQPIGSSNRNVEIFLSREETLKNVLNFYKTMDIEYYSEALDYLLQLKRNKSLYIFSGNRNDLSENEREIIKGKGRNEYEEITCEWNIYVPTRLSELKGEDEIISKNKDMIVDSRTIVHEIAHCFDKTKTEGVFPIVASAKTVKLKGTKEYEQINEKIIESNKVRDVFTEVTAITFEKLYLQYLMEHTSYPKNNIRNLLIRRFNSSFFTTCVCYEYLRIAKIKEEKGYISNNELEEIKKEFNVDEKYMNMLTGEIIEESEKFSKTKRYAIAGLFVPTLIECYHEKGVDVLKQYIQAVKNNSIDQVFEVLQIEKNEKGIEKLIANVKKDIETFNPQICKENEEDER